MHKSSKYPILIVDDEPEILEVVSLNIRKLHKVIHTAQRGEEALSKISKGTYSIVILDYNLPDINGIHLLQEIKKKDKDILVIMITAHSSIEMAVEAMKAGAFNFLVKPVNFSDLELLIGKALESHAMMMELKQLREQAEMPYAITSIVGKSKKMLDALDKVKTISGIDATVLIQGETGTGKELFGNAIHHNSERRKGPFIKVNCAAIPETLLESELFGYEKGAFTGALARKKGKFELAHGGTILLDEIGEIPMAMQAKLLRVLCDGEVDRVGGAQPVKVDIRVIASTNVDLEKAIHENKFRMDLFYRLNVIPIFIPSLRERKDDIPLLVNYFIDKFNKKYRKSVETITPSLMTMLMEYKWPGNVRELENILERAIVLSQADVLENLDLPTLKSKTSSFGSNLPSMSFQEAKKKVIESFELQFLLELLKKHKGNIRASSHEAQMDYKNFYSKLKKYNLIKKQYADEENY